MGHKKHRSHKYGQNPHLEPLSPREINSELSEVILEKIPDDNEPDTAINFDNASNMDQEQEQLFAPEEPSQSSKKIKNLTAAVILLGGLLIGSLFVDIASLASRDGLSALAVKKNTVLTAGGKTWVAYADPKVNISVITEKECEKCSPDEALVWLRRILPTIEARPIEATSDEGKKLVESFGIMTLPAFVFDKDVTSTDFFGLAEQIFTEKEGSYLLDTAQLGMTPGKYLKTPEIAEDDIKIGNENATVRIVEYSDFQCPYCRAFHASIKKTLEEYGDRVLFSYKHLPLSFHPQAENAALASECANEQGKFAEYSDSLFEKQPIWGNSTGTQAFKVIARQLGLKTSDFNSCLDDRKYADKVVADAEEAASFGISGTPGTFIGDTFIGGAIGYEEMKTAIEEQLAK